jgi:hypothetical protein
MEYRCPGYDDEIRTFNFIFQKLVDQAVDTLGSQNMEKTILLKSKISKFKENLDQSKPKNDLCTYLFNNDLFEFPYYKALSEQFYNERSLKKA